MPFKDYTWKKEFNCFKDETLWEKRIKKLGFKSDSEFRAYLKKLKNKKIVQADRFFLKKIIKMCNLVDKDLFTKISSSQNILNCTLSPISFYCLNFFEETIEKYPLLMENEIKKIKDSITKQLINKIFQFTKPTVQFEYFIFLKAYELEDTSESLNKFVNDYTLTSEWVEYYFESYPVLLNVLHSFSLAFQKQINIILQRLSSDINEFSECFSFNCKLLLISDIQLFLGDPHKSWECTTLFTFNKSIKIFYKPKNLSGEIFFNNFICFINSLGFERSVQLTKNLNKGPYGWQLSIDYTPFDDIKIVPHFYYLQGLNLGIAYILNIQDLIADNIIVNREHPVFYDMEMILIPEIREGEDYKSKSAAGKEFNEGIIKTGLIPVIGFETYNNIGYSNSGISKVSGNNYKVFEYINNKKTLSTYKIKSKDKNLPKFENKIILIDSFIKDFEKGFIDSSTFFLQNKNPILKFINNSLDLIKNIQSRVLIRFTFIYQSILNESYFPLYVASWLEYQKLLEILWHGYQEDLLPENVIQSEINQLMNNEVPYFYTTPLSRDLFDFNGEIVIKNYFKKSGFNFIKRRILKLNQDCIEQQKNILRRSLYIHHNFDGSLDYKCLDEPIGKKVKHPSINIGEFLFNLNRSKKVHPYFAYIDYVLTKDDLWSQGVQNSDIFQGTEGVALFFVALYKTFNNLKYLNAAKKIFNQSIELFIKNKNWFFDTPSSKIGITNFPISTLFFVLKANEILKDEYFLFSETELNLLLSYIETKYVFDTSYDYFSGSTGTLLLLIAFYKKNKSKRIFDLLNKIGNYLILNSKKLSQESITWERSNFDKWGGVAHGNSFISYALFELASVSNNQDFYKAGIYSLNYDQSLFDLEKSIWKKSVDFLGEIHHSWANGSAGIGLSRMLISRHFKNEFMKKEITIALKNINDNLEAAMIEDHSICSGFLGMVEIASILDEQLNYEPIIKSYISKLNTLKDLRCGGWEKNPLITGLFYGFAGIGYNLLKLSYNKNLPSLLWI